MKNWLFMLSFIVFAGPVNANYLLAHDNYEESCCSNQDCKNLQDWKLEYGLTIRIEEDENGYQPYLYDEKFGDLIPFDSDKVREPIDSEWHICIDIEDDYSLNDDGQSQVLCIYPPYQLT